MSVASILVAPSTTWLLVSTSPSAVSTIPVPAASPPRYPRVVSIFTSAGDTPAAIAAGSLDSPRTGGWPRGSPNRLPCAGDRLTCQATGPSGASRTRPSTASTRPARDRRGAGAGGGQGGGGGQYPVGASLMTRLRAGILRGQEESPINVLRILCPMVSERADGQASGGAVDLPRVRNSGAGTGTGRTGDAWCRYGPSPVWSPGPCRTATA